MQLHVLTWTVQMSSHWRGLLADPPSHWYQHQHGQLYMRKQHSVLYNCTCIYLRWLAYMYMQITSNTLFYLQLQREAIISGFKHTIKAHNCIHSSSHASLEQPLNDPPLIIPTSLAPSPMARVTAFLYFFTRSTTFFCVRTEDTVHINALQIRKRWKNVLYM